MDATLYTGNATTNTITNAGGFQPDLVWMKSRGNNYSHVLYDAVRGTGTSKALYSDATSAEGADTTLQNLTSFNSNGFSLGATSSTNIINSSGGSFVGWQWRASNATGVSNTAGSITSTVSANTTAGFSVVTYTGNNVAGATIGHGLGVAPSMIIVKKRNTTGDWPVYHSSVGNTGGLYLDLTLATQTTASLWNNTSPTSTVFSVGGGGVSGSGDVNANASTYVAYCFSEVAGYSKFGSYTGNGSTDGTFVYLGFRPKYVLIKRTDSASEWYCRDSVRDTYNPVNNTLFPNTSAAEENWAGAYPIDLTSNGFKLRTSVAGFNASGGTFIYMAFAENPFKYSLAR
jgi:hypothetical protein